MTATLEDGWNALASAALLGTARRPPPSPPDGPFEAFAQPLDLAAALDAARRAGVRPGPVGALLVPAPVDVRPVCRESAAVRLTELIEYWPVLVDEWLERAHAGGWRLAPELVPGLLARVRAEPRRRAAVSALAGPLADWLVGLGLAPPAAPARTGRGAPTAQDADDHLPTPPADLAGLWRLDGPALASALADGLERAQLANRHRPMLVRLLCEVPVGHLAPVAQRLGRAGTNAATMGLALHLADLATTRAAMIQELLP